MFRKVNKEDGSITIEATISLTAFMFMIFTVLTIVNICLIQAKMSYALNNTAKEISQYSYLYSLTGLVESQSNMYEQGKNDTKALDDTLNNINAVFEGIESLKDDVSSIPDSKGIEDVVSKWNEITKDGEAVKGSVGDLKGSLDELVSDPKGLIFGIAKLAGNKAMDYMKSKALAEPLAKALVKKHLVSKENGNIDDYLKRLYVQPSATGSYFDGIDFEGSIIFPNGTPEIRICASYDVKVVPLLPIDFEFHFSQQAVTRGWMAGDNDFVSAKEYVENNTLWTKTSVQERATLIRKLAISELQAKGYDKTSGLTNVHMYNKDKNEFVMISSTNPLWSETSSDMMTVNDISEKAVQEGIEQLIGKLLLNTNGVTQVTLKKENKKDGTTTKEIVNCEGASKKIVLAIPEDPGLQEKMQKIIDKMDTKGVTIDLLPGFGTGTNKTISD